MSQPDLIRFILDLSELFFLRRRAAFRLSLACRARLRAALRCLALRAARIADRDLGLEPAALRLLLRISRLILLLLLVDLGLRDLLLVLRLLALLLLIALLLLSLLR